MTISDTDLLLIIDVQNDFCPGGALAVEDGDSVLPVINRLIGKFKNIVITQDWHPIDHSSFTSNHEGQSPFSVVTMPYGEQTLWPDHCIQGTHGAEFHKDLITYPASLIIRKGMNPAIDSYSAFFENDRSTGTGLGGYLRERNIKRIICTGLAFDFCVFYSAEDSVKEQFETVVVTDACRAIDMDGTAQQATDAMKSAGITLLGSDEL